MITFNQLSIPDVVLINPQIFIDERGFFFEAFNQKEFENAIQRNVVFVQDNHSRSTMGVLRGLHYQKEPYQQGKLVRVIHGKIWDVVVDIRKDSKTYGKWIAEELSSENKKQLWIPEGFAHGFITLSKDAEVLYKTNNYYSPEHECSIKYDDPVLNIDWLMNHKEIILNDKDTNAINFKDIMTK